MSRNENHYENETENGEYTQNNDGNKRTNQDDDLNGMSGNDDIFSAEGNDYLRGNEGDDHLDGGTGIDTSTYRGKRSEYSITKDTAGLTHIEDHASGRDGHDTINNVERIKFSDGNIALDINGNAGQAYRLYKAAFDRTPDDVGLGGWIKHLDSGANLQSAAQSFIASAEFSAKYGSNTSNDEFVNLLYRNALHREAEKSGHDHWVNGLNHGMSRAEVLSAFSESTENQAQTAPLVGQGIHYQEWMG
jgi:hypothetical protein